MNCLPYISVATVALNPTAATGVRQGNRVFPISATQSRATLCRPPLLWDVRHFFLQICRIPPLPPLRKTLLANSFLPQVHGIGLGAIRDLFAGFGEEFGLA
jgi:hypothetical protein